MVLLCEMSLAHLYSIAAGNYERVNLLDYSIYLEFSSTISSSQPPKLSFHARSPGMLKPPFQQSLFKPARSLKSTSKPSAAPTFICFRCSTFNYSARLHIVRYMSPHILENSQTFVMPILHLGDTQHDKMVQPPNLRLDSRTQKALQILRALPLSSFGRSRQLALYTPEIALNLQQE
jgi:hypothetical protein